MPRVKSFILWVLRTPPLPGFLLMAPFVTLYGVVMLFRRARLQTAAAAIGATYVTERWWRPGKIVGRTFTVEITRYGKSFSTVVQVRVPLAPFSFLLAPHFFDGFPNWTHVLALGLERQRVFFAEVSLERYVPLTAEQRDVLMRWLDEAAAAWRVPYEMVRAAQVSQIFIQDECAWTRVRGIVSNPERLRRILDVMNRFASEKAATPGSISTASQPKRPRRVISVGIDG